MDLRVPTLTCNWILDILSDRPQVLSIDNTVIVKYADGTTIPCLMKGGDKSGHRELVNNFLVSGEKNGLILDIDQPKKIILDFSRMQPLQSLVIKRIEVERADSQPCDNKPEQDIKRCCYSEKCPAVALFHQAVKERILTYGITVWFGDTTQAERNSL